MDEYQVRELVNIRHDLIAAAARLDNLMVREPSSPAPQDTARSTEARGSAADPCQEWESEMAEAQGVKPAPDQTWAPSTGVAQGVVPKEQLRMAFIAPTTPESSPLGLAIRRYRVEPLCSCAEPLVGYHSLERPFLACSRCGAGAHIEWITAQDAPATGST